MADVRSMLRTERAARRIHHPHAYYSSSGLLSCSVCKITIKSEAVWESHLRSVGHATRLQQQRLSSPTKVPANTNDSTKKRKLEVEQDDEASTKKARSIKDRSIMSIQTPSIEEESVPVHAVLAANDSKRSTTPIADAPPSKPVSNPLVPVSEFENVDEDEWAAFEKDIATSEQRGHPRSAFLTASTISAKPMTTSEVAAQTHESEAGQQKSKEAEIEEEREEAARQAEEELDRMAQLDEKMKAWRRRQEVLKSLRDSSLVTENGLEEQDRSTADTPLSGTWQTVTNQVVDNEEEEEDDDDWDPWRGLGGIT